MPPAPAIGRQADRAGRDIQVLDESMGPAITLITCFPFEYVGSAPLRLIVRALPDDPTKTKLIASAQGL